MLLFLAKVGSGELMQTSCEKEQRPMDWKLGVRRPFPLFHLHLAFEAMVGPDMIRVLGARRENVLAISHRGITEIFFGEEDAEFRRRAATAFLRAGNPTVYIAEIKRRAKHLVLLSQSIQPAHLTSLPKRSLSGILTRYCRACCRLLVFQDLVTATDKYYTPRLLELITEKAECTSEHSQTLLVDMTTTTTGIITSEQRSFWQSALQLSRILAPQGPNRPLDKDLAYDDLPRAARRVIADHVAHFGWTMVNPEIDFRGDEVQLDKMRRRVSVILLEALSKAGPDEIRQRLAQMADYPAKVIGERRKAFAEVRYAPGILRLAARLRGLSEVRNLYLRPAINQGNYHFTAFLSEIARRAHIDVMGVKFTSPRQIREYLTRGRPFDRELMRLAEEHCALLTRGGNELQVFIGAEVQKLAEREGLVRRGPEVRGELRGRAACPGVAVGQVKVVQSEEDIDRMVPGAILVSRTASAYLALAVKKALAIVTEIGGVTCHAVSMARENNLPCIVGVEEATKVLKDGDTVMVDGNLGIVRRIGSS